MVSHVLEESGLTPDCSRYEAIHDLLHDVYMGMSDEALKKILDESCKNYV